MTFPGLGHQDWVELDLDAFDLTQHAGIVDRLQHVSPKLTELVGGEFEIQASADGTATVLSGGLPRFGAEINARGRLVITAIPQSEGPL